MNKLVIISISYTLLIVYALGYLSIAFFGNYGWLLFLLAPFLLGFAPSFVISNIEPVSKKKSYVLGFTSLFLACLGLVVLGVEGLICILMASPLFIAATFLGILLVDRINIQKINNPRIILLIILAYILSFFTLDYVNDTNQLIPITSSIVIDKPIETVWEVTTNNIEISKPDLFLDKFGIGYPKSITFFNKGVGATRDFNFSTGSYLQSVTAWDAPNLISFETKKSPMQMIENNPFWEIHPMHLNGYFVSVRGDVKLTELSENKTKVENITWYRIHITPMFYWKFWGNTIVKRFQDSYLKSLKITSEK